MTELTENTQVVVFFDPQGGEIFVFRYCPECGRFLKTGKLFTDLEGGNVHLKDWICKRHGEVQPDWDRL